MRTLSSRRAAARAPGALMLRLGVLAALVASSLLVAQPASAHGGAVGASSGASPAGPLRAVVTMNATWLGDGDPGGGLAVSVTGSGPGGAIGPAPLPEVSEGTYRATLTFPAGGPWNLVVSWSGNESIPGSVGAFVEVESPAAPPATTQAPAPAPGAPGTNEPGATVTTTTVPGAAPSDQPTVLAPSAPLATTTLRGVPVVVSPNHVARGAYVALTFAVPNLSPSADVTSVSIALPKRLRLPAVTTQAMPDWAATLTTRKLAKPLAAAQNITEVVSVITWTTQSQGLRPGEVELFTVSLGPLPKRGTGLTFSALAQLATGEVLRWDTPVTKADRDPSRPAPSIRLVRGSSANGRGAGPHD